MSSEAEYFKREGGEHGPVHKIEPLAIVRRAAELVDELNSARERIGDLESRLRSALHGDEPTLEQLAAQLGAEGALLREIFEWVQQHPSLEDVLPPDFMVRLSAQLKLPHYREESPNRVVQVIRSDTLPLWSLISPRAQQQPTEPKGTAVHAQP
jgi:hypothetical protein